MEQHRARLVPLGAYVGVLTLTLALTLTLTQVKPQVEQKIGEWDKANSSSSQLTTSKNYPDSKKNLVRLKGAFLAAFLAADLAVSDGPTGPQ